jgi:uridine phosphorylase
VSEVAPANEILSKLVFEELKQSLRGQASILEGLNLTADSFYSSQGRIDDSFDDNNVNLIEHITAQNLHAKTMEMESFTLLHLAKCSRKQKIAATAASIVVANRLTADVVDGVLLDTIELLGGKAVLNAIIKFVL